MSINLQSEHVVTLSEAVKHLPSLRPGKRLHVSTVYRWIQQGTRGVRLESIRVGDTLCTSLEALQRFCDRLSADGPEMRVRTPASRKRAVEAAGRQCEAMGV